MPSMPAQGSYAPPYNMGPYEYGYGYPPQSYPPFNPSSVWLFLDFLHFFGLAYILETLQHVKMIFIPELIGLFECNNYLNIYLLFYQIGKRKVSRESGFGLGLDK